MSPFPFRCRQHSTHTEAFPTIIDFQTIFYNQMSSVCVGLNSVCYSIPSYTIKTFCCSGLEFRTHKITILQRKRHVVVHVCKQITRQCSKMLRKPVYWISFYLAQNFKICWRKKNNFFLFRIFIFLPFFAASGGRTTPPFPQLHPFYYAMSKNVSILSYGYFCKVLKKKTRKTVNTRLSYFYCYLSHGRRHVLSDRLRTCSCRGSASTISEPQINPFLRQILREGLIYSNGIDKRTL